MSKYAHNVVSDQDLNTPWYKIMQWLPDGQKVLDVGCSSGYFGEKLMVAKKAEVWGLELDPSDAQKARQRGYKEVFEGDLDQFDWRQLQGLKFDAIVFADVLEHIKDPVGCLKIVKKMLRPGGYIYASVPNVSHISVRVELMEGNFDYESTGLLDNTHIRFFTEKTINSSFAAAGLRIAKRDATINDVPDGQVKAHLQKLGLTPQAKFDKLLHSTAARTFQFIIAATPTRGAVATEPVLSEKLHDDWPKIAKKMADDDKTIQRLQQQLQAAETQAHQLEQRLHYLKTHPVRATVKAIKRRLG